MEVPGLRWFSAEELQSLADFGEWGRAQSASPKQQYWLIRTVEVMLTFC